MRLAITTTAIASLGLIAGVIVSLFVLQSASDTSQIVLGSFTVRTADAAARPRLTERSAEASARTEAGKRLSETIGGLARIHGSPISITDLTIVGSAFAPAATEISSSASNFRFTTSSPADLWVFIYQANGGWRCQTGESPTVSSKLRWSSTIPPVPSNRRAL